MFMGSHGCENEFKYCPVLNLAKKSDNVCTRGCYIWVRMKKKEIAREVSRKTGVTRAEAVHEVDRLVHDILHQLRNGKTANLPGLGKLTTGSGGRIRFLKARA